MIMPDGSKRGTFRSYTFFVYADNFTASNLTFENAAGFGDEFGQAIAVYAEGDNITFRNCKILGHQDTLFTGPLPMKEKQPGGFTGPTIDGIRRVSTSYMKTATLQEKLILYLEVLLLTLKTHPFCTEQKSGNQCFL